MKLSKVYLSADLEGVCGVVSAEQVTPSDKRVYRQAIQQLAAEVNAVAEALLEAGVEQVVVNDAHAHMRNLVLPQLHSSLSLISGKPKSPAMMAELDETYLGCIFLGYHAKAGTRKAVLVHSFHDAVFDLQLNGHSLGEGGMNALYAWQAYQVPLLLASGDDAFCREIEAVCPRTVTVTTKKALSFSSAYQRPVQTVMSELQQQTREALAALKKSKSKQQPPVALSLEPPYTLQLTLTHPQLADLLEGTGTWQRSDGHTLATQCETIHTLFSTLQSAYTLFAYAETI